MESKNDRADKVLVALGHFESRAAAQAAIAAGKVLVNGRVLSKASEKISLAAKIEAETAHPWVSRAGIKLAHALTAFEADPTGKPCLDIGASTGGFTDVLLTQGAASVVAVDVGREQLHARIKADTRVISLESTDARHLKAEQVGKPKLIVCDASFISLNKLLRVPLSYAQQGAQLITLFKPQFEVGRENIGKGGIVKDTNAVEQAEEAFIEWLAGEGWQVLARIDSPITGGDGNAERLIHARKK
ncbi:TlyA family RNA methyltransferase [Hyphomonas sp. FCG-A18]|nr:TlyA family RNA methyltransferase [Hyphomonas sp. FCG-A18]